MRGRSRRRGSLAPEERTLLEGLVRDLGPRLAAYVHRVYGLRHEAEDIVAEAFCRAVQNIAALRASERQDLYLLTTVRNLCRDRFRRNRPESTPPDILEERPAREGAGVEPSAEELEALRAAVARLPENQREVVVLRLSTGLKFEEIAAVLHVPLGTALSRMHGAVQALRGMLAEQR
jgi:RNA polymerase sigma-70 factor (ECF subfamily)